MSRRSQGEGGIAHLSDLHMRDAGDAAWLERQLDRIAAHHPQHLAITGDLLDRWSPALLDLALDALDRRGFLHRDRLTILHGNHDLASSGGHPRRGADLWRLVTRFWDPPPLLASRRRRFHEQIARRAEGIAAAAPFLKTLTSGLRIAVLDTVPAVWVPVSVGGGELVVRHAIGRVPASQCAWLSALPREGRPLVLLLHHYPLDTPPFRWSPDRGSQLPFSTVQVPMDIPEPGRTALWDAVEHAGVRLVVCGHVHRARLTHHRGIAVGLNGQSGAAWAGRTIAWYDVSDGDVRMDIETVDA